MANSKSNLKLSSFSFEDAVFVVREIILLLQPAIASTVSRDRLVVRTLRCGGSIPGSNPSPDISILNVKVYKKILNLVKFYN